MTSKGHIGTPAQNGYFNQRRKKLSIKIFSELL